VTTQVEELPDNKVRLTVDVPSADVHHAVEHAASDLASSVKIPGFRKGKVPVPVLVNRIGKERLYAEAVESHISGWYGNAVARSRIRPAARPELEYELPTSDDQDWRFTATVPVLPLPEVADWTQLEVGAPEVEVPEEIVNAELDVLRGSVAELSPVEDRPAQAGDTLVLDLIREGGEAQRDYVVELGSGRLVPELEQQLLGMSTGETREIRFELPDDRLSTVEATVKEIKEKVLPPLDDDLAKAASEFDTVDDLRAEIEGRLRGQIEADVNEAFRRAALDKLVDASSVSVGGPVVDSRTRALLESFDEMLRRRGGSLETYIQVTGTSPDELVGRFQAEAQRSVAGELVLEVVADRLGIEVGDEQVDEAIRERFEDADRVIEQLRAGGAYETERESLRLSAALDRVAAEVKRIPLEQEQAREAIWTPEKETPKTETKLWTPGSKEPA
jgi:trigger factor